MWPSLVTHNVNNIDIMPHGVTCDANPNDVMHASCDIHTPVSWASICNNDMPQFTY